MVDSRRQYYFPEVYLALDREIQHHEELVGYLQNHPAVDFEVRIAEIASYVGIVLDDVYNQKDMDKLAGILLKRLQDQRVQLILPLEITETT